MCKTNVIRLSNDLSQNVDTSALGQALQYKYQSGLLRPVLLLVPRSSGSVHVLRKVIQKADDIVLQISQVLVNTNNNFKLIRLLSIFKSNCVLTNFLEYIKRRDKSKTKLAAFPSRSLTQKHRIKFLDLSMLTRFSLANAEKPQNVKSKTTSFRHIFLSNLSCYTSCPRTTQNYGMDY